MLSTVLVLALSNRSCAEEKKKPNVLFIAIDDLRPELGCYGAEHIYSPNIDQLANEGTLFNKAYCQVAVCAPSRISLMSGLRPDNTGCLILADKFRPSHPDALYLHQYFANFGYKTVGMGKILHQEEPNSWTKWLPSPSKLDVESHLTDEELEAYREMAKKKNLQNKGGNTIPKLKLAVTHLELPDEEFIDCKIANDAISALKELKDETFFLAVGFKRPHLPFVMPTKYWNLYDHDSIKLCDNPYPPNDLPQGAATSWGELRNHTEIPNSGPVSDEMALKLRHGYYACVSFVDHQVGRLMAALKEEGLDENTIVILWGDHGWKLGEHGMWAKHTAFENDTWTPLIVRYPNAVKTPGKTSQALVEYVDIYPSLCDLAGIPIPESCDGTSFKPLLNNPDAPWKRAAFSTWFRGNRGRSIRTERFRYTEWRNPKTSKLEGIELYDHLNDPQENRNLCNNVEYQSDIKVCAAILNAGWEKSKPGD